MARGDERSNGGGGANYAKAHCRREMTTTQRELHLCTQLTHFLLLQAMSRLFSYLVVLFDLKGIVHPKMKIHLFTLMSFQTCMDFFLKIFLESVTPSLQ